MTRLNYTTALVCILAVVLAGFIFSSRRNSELEKVQQAIHNLSASLDGVQQDIASLSNLVASLRAEKLQNEEFGELMRLRAEITALRKERDAQPPEGAAEAALEAPKDAPLLHPEALPREAYGPRGFANARSSLETVLWAITRKDPEAFLIACAPEMQKMFESQFADMPPGVMPGGFQNGAMFRASGFRVMEERQLSENEIGLKVFLEGRNLVLKMKFQRIGNEWKWAGNMVDWDPPN